MCRCGVGLTTFHKRLATPAARSGDPRSGILDPPLAIELACGIGLRRSIGGRSPSTSRRPFWASPGRRPRCCNLQIMSHAILLAFLLVATFIDFDEQTIPDASRFPAR
jgi:hypothetical protein